MNVIKTEIEGVLILEPRIFEDPRGYFFESFSQRTGADLILEINTPDECPDYMKAYVKQ